MQDIVGSAVENTRKSGGKRVAAYHLCVYERAPRSDSRKRAIEGNENFDFLKNIVENVADPLSGGTPSRGGKRRKVAKEEAQEATPKPAPAAAEAPDAEPKEESD